MYHVLDVCRYVINYCNENHYDISNLKLQKILYFIQARFLIEEKNSKPCFHEKIEAWDFGPVIPIAYREYKEYGAYSIPKITSFYKLPDNPRDGDIIFLAKEVPYEDNVIKEQDKILINEVVDKFASYTATRLVTLTHNQDPWMKNYEPNKNNEITQKDIQEYFQ